MHKSEFQMVKKDKNPTSIAFAIMRFMVAIKSYFRNISLVARYNRKVSAVSSFFFFPLLKPQGHCFFIGQTLLGLVFFKLYKHLYKVKSVCADLTLYRCMTL